MKSIEFFSWRRSGLILFLAVVILVLSSSHPALADVAPPEQPPGSSLGPGEEVTQVQMLSEEVIIEVGDPANIDPSWPENHAVEAVVSARFTMRNQGEQEERMTVRFPLNNVEGWGDGFGRYPQVQDFTVSVGAQQLDWSVVPSTNPWDADEPPLLWAAFGVTFPVDRDIVIKVSYTLLSTGYLPEARFSYILETGAGWYGSIGEGDIILRLPYRATSENVLSGEYETIPGVVFAGKEVRWHFEDLEPTRADNWHVTILQPSLWQQILDMQAAVDKDPEDVDSLAALGEAAFNASAAPKEYLRVGMERLFLLSEDCFRRAVALRPEDASLHGNYAKTLAIHYAIERLGWTSLDEPAPTIEQVMAEINTTMALDPDSDLAWQAFWELKFAVPDDVELPTPGPSPASDSPLESPTSTSEPAVSPEFTPTQKATSTLLPSQTPGVAATETPIADPGASPAKCLGGMFVVVLVVIPGFLGARKPR